MVRHMGPPRSMTDPTTPRPSEAGAAHQAETSKSLAAAMAPRARCSVIVALEKLVPLSMEMLVLFEDVFAHQCASAV